MEAVPKAIAPAPAIPIRNETESISMEVSTVLKSREGCLEQLVRILGFGIAMASF